jgi:hypothetical protein
VAVPTRKPSNPLKPNDALPQALREGETATVERPASPSATMQERLDQQATDWLNGQPRILKGLDDFGALERLALAKDEKGMMQFLRKRAREAAKEQLTYWKKFFKLQRPERGRPPEAWVEDGASMRTNGKSWDWIAQNLFPEESKQDSYPYYPTRDRVRKAVTEYCHKVGIPLPRGGRNSSD